MEQILAAEAAVRKVAKKAAEKEAVRIASLKARIVEYQKVAGKAADNKTA